MEKLVSIIIPAYNAARWIAETMRSALNQTWAKKEIIVVDDGSTDGTYEIAKRHESKGVLVVQQENRGVSAARNTGLSLAQGSYIQWLDADDILESDKISKQMQYSEEGSCGRTLFTSSFGTFYFCPQRARMAPTILWQDLDPVEWLLGKFNSHAWMNPATWLISRKLTELAGPWDEQLVRDNDGEYICRVVTVSERVRFIHDAISYYRVCNLGSLSYNLSDKASECLTQSIILCTEYLLAMENSERTRSACLNYLQSPVIYFYPEKENLLRRLEARALQLGGRLEVPELRRKYHIIRAIFGLEAAIKVMIMLPRLKIRALARFDEILSRTIYNKRKFT